MTSMVHGRHEAERAERASAVLFTEGIAELDAATLAGALEDAPTSEVARAEVEAGLGIREALLRSGLATSGRNASQLLAQGSVYVNGRRAGEDRMLVAGDVLHGRWIVLRRGKTNQHVLVLL